jgi:hypothetical protein
MTKYYLRISPNPSAWTNLANWWQDEAATIPAANLPVNGDDVVFLSTYQHNNPEPTVTLSLNSITSKASGVFFRANKLFLNFPTVTASGNGEIYLDSYNLVNTSFFVEDLGLVDLRFGTATGISIQINKNSQFPAPSVAIRAEQVSGSITSVGSVKPVISFNQASIALTVSDSIIDTSGNRSGGPGVSDGDFSGGPGSLVLNGSSIFQNSANVSNALNVSFNGTSVNDGTFDSPISSLTFNNNSINNAVITDGSVNFLGSSVNNGQVPATATFAPGTTNNQQNNQQPNIMPSAFQIEIIQRNSNNTGLQKLLVDKPAVPSVLEFLPDGTAVMTPKSTLSGVPLLDMGAIIHVNPQNPAATDTRTGLDRHDIFAPFATLQAAINEAVDNETIIVYSTPEATLIDCTAKALNLHIEPSVTIQNIMVGNGVVSGEGVINAFALMSAKACTLNVSSVGSITLDSESILKGNNVTIQGAVTINNSSLSNPSTLTLRGGSLNSTLTCTGGGEINLDLRNLTDVASAFTKTGSGSINYKAAYCASSVDLDNMTDFVNQFELGFNLFDQQA